MIIVLLILRLTVGRFSLGGPGRVMLSLHRCAPPPSYDRGIHAHGILSAELPAEPINSVCMKHYLHVGSGWWHLVIPRPSTDLQTADGR